jgi:hypothetical protein
MKLPPLYGSSDMSKNFTQHLLLFSILFTMLPGLSQAQNRASEVPA